MKSLAGLIVMVLTFAPVVALAQTNLSSLLSSATSNTPPDLGITVSPQTPGPDSIVSLSLASSALDLADSSITWYQNGRVIDQGTGVTTTTLTTGSLGSHLSISVSVTASDGTLTQAQATIFPTEVDLLFDGNTYVPPFYDGRALPSAGTTIRAQAEVFFKRSDGTLVPPSQIRYTWKEGGVVVGTASGTGKSSALLPAPPLYGNTDLEVDASSLDGTFSGSAVTTIPAAPVQIILYQDHPLFGIVYNSAISANASMSQSQVTFAAVPYFAQVRSPNDANLTYTWSVNGSNVAASAQDPSEITVNSQNSSGRATLAVGITHATNIFLSAQGSWSIAFGSAGNIGSTPQAGNPFNARQ